MDLLRLSNYCSRVAAPLAGGSANLNGRLLRFPRQTSDRGRDRSRVRKAGSAPRCSMSIHTSTSVNAEEKEILEKGKGWMDARGVQDDRILFQFNQLAILASDRVEMHKILADQRDNWNQLFHSTITIASGSAAIVLAMIPLMEAPGLSLVAAILNIACAALMTLVNVEQPSQLAEEQRTAARFFRRLRVEVEATLKIDPQLREDASAYWEKTVGTLHALDHAFPLPLTPNGLEKFPKQIVPAELSPVCPDPDEMENGNVDKDENQQLPSSRCSACQWTPLTEVYVKQLTSRIGEKQVPELIELAEKAKLVNLWLARISPIPAAGSAFLNVLVYTGVLSPSDQVSWVAATLNLVAFFSHSFSHALQLGSILEVYRTAAGYYTDIQKSVNRSLKLPKQRREDFNLFLLKLNLEVGRRPRKRVVHGDNKYQADRSSRS